MRRGIDYTHCLSSVSHSREGKRKAPWRYMIKLWKRWRNIVFQALLVLTCVLVILTSTHERRGMFEISTLSSVFCIILTLYPVQHHLTPSITSLQVFHMS
ncbi:hypothetical protein I7I53_05338 [Histoplasma capsulatum var. duboisii H88]|uniref:Uncharacterized protein n=1 Tax=Ajellomyces capsulatus (strain H88) TaxID=544711 RepID=A0A8A1LSR0_AJEC8|nr:hypothetical protein I7I53_05338 [Histoplasma capsulatum var. duboisii H88]